MLCIKNAGAFSPGIFNADDIIFTYIIDHVAVGDPPPAVVPATIDGATVAVAGMFVAGVPVLVLICTPTNVVPLFSTNRMPVVADSAAYTRLPWVCFAPMT